LFDESGINTVGNGIGHDIVAVVDGNYMESVVLNDYFSPSTDSYQGGEVLYQLGTFANGKHSLTLKAWDVFNNSSEATIEFVVNTGAQIVITGVQVQPNPMQDATQFVFDHNKPGEDLDVSIHIYSLMGQMSCRLDYSFNTENLKSIPFTWYGRNSSGDELPSGLYVYHIRVTSADGTSTEVTQKLMISR
jgi:hypothetical protein